MLYNTFYGLFRAETPINHGADEKMETTTLCRYNTVLLHDGKEVKVYNISAAAFRHVIRYYGAQKLLSLLGMTIHDIPEIVCVILFSGGPRIEKAEIVPLEYMRFIRQNFPIIDLMGCTTQFCMIQGKLSATAINVLAKEVVESDFFIESNILEAFNLNPAMLPSVVVEFQFNAKRDPRLEVFDITNPKDTPSGVVANIFETQMICKGARMGHQVLIRDYDDHLLESCFASALAEWQRCGGHLGGKINQGCGQVSFEYRPQLVSPEQYETFVLQRADALREMLTDKVLWLDRDISHYKLISF